MCFKSFFPLVRSVLNILALPAFYPLHHSLTLYADYFSHLFLFLLFLFVSPILFVSSFLLCFTSSPLLFFFSSFTFNFRILLFLWLVFLFSHISFFFYLTFSNSLFYILLFPFFEFFVVFFFFFFYLFKFFYKIRKDWNIYSTDKLELFKKIDIRVILQ